MLYNQLISFLVSLDYGSYDLCVPPSATRQRHHTYRYWSLSLEVWRSFLEHQRNPPRVTGTWCVDCVRPEEVIEGPRYVRANFREASAGICVRWRGLSSRRHRTK